MTETQYAIAATPSSMSEDPIPNHDGAYICARFSPQFRCVSSLRANSPHPRLSVPQPKRNFSHTTRKDGSIWDEDDDQTPEPPTPQRIPGRPNRARPAVHRNVSDLVRARVDGAARIAQRKDIEKQLNYLVSSRQLMVGAFVQLKYQHIDDRISELINVNESLQAEWKTLSLTLEKRVSDMMSQITKKVLQAKRTTDECADELAILSERIITRHIEVIADARDRVLQAEKITQKYVQEVTHLSASILGLKRLQVAVMESDDVCRLIDHEFCRTVFARIPEWENKLKVFDQNMRQWEKLVRTARLKRLSEQVHYSERSIFRLRVALYEEYIAPRIKRLSKQVHNSERLISRLRETVHEEHLEPRKAARDRIDRVLAQSDLILEEYRKLRATHEQITFSHISKLCGDLSRSENIRPTDQYRFLVFANDISAGQADLYLRLHVYRSNWLQRQWDAHPLRQSEAWNLHGITNAVATRDLGDRSPHIIQQIALASPNKIGFIRRNALQLSHKFKSVYRPIWKQRPARSPELPMYWRQLDVLGPFYIVNFSSWLIGEEVHYLLASLKGQCGELWSWLPETTLAHSIDILHQWCTTDHARRSELRTELTKYRQLNWLRLRTETTLHSLGEPVYLAGKFEVRNPLSQDAQRFEVWSRTMGELITGAFVARLAQHTSVDQWNELYRNWVL
ncbi:hypothetical protein N7461_002713 [Penicillium sp. DV-2018c]|nr:hypothetical protein N7461_002713 [Penicillium sp. DV-2018c]